MSKREQYAEILGVRPNASGKEIKKAYRDLRRVWQPQCFSDQPKRQREAEEKLQKITEAYQQLQALRRQAQQQATQSEDREKPANSQSAKTPEVIDSSDQQTTQPTNQSVKTPEVIDSSDQQTPQPEVRPAPADRQLVRLPKPKQPFVPVPLPEKPAPGRFVFFTLSAIAAVIILLLIITQLYEQTKTVVSSSQQTAGALSPPSPSSLEDLMDTISPPEPSASPPTSPSASKSRKPTGSELDPESRSAGKRSSEARNTTERLESARGQQQTNKRTSVEPIPLEDQPLQPSQ